MENSKPVEEVDRPVEGDNGKDDASNEPNSNEKDAAINQSKDTTQGMSKNQLKKLRRTQKWEEHKAEKRYRYYMYPCA